jgi:hypothetical protein
LRSIATQIFLIVLDSLRGRVTTDSLAGGELEGETSRGMPSASRPRKVIYGRKADASYPCAACRPLSLIAASLCSQRPNGVLDTVGDLADLLLVDNEGW